MEAIFAGTSMTVDDGKRLIPDVRAFGLDSSNTFKEKVPLEVVLIQSVIPDDGYP
jgi:hypothetical protein